MNRSITIVVSPRALHRLALLALCLACAAAGFGAARAANLADADALAYGGTLEEGGALVEGTRTLQVRLFEAAVDGAQLCESSADDVDVRAGHFRVPLPAACATATRNTASAFVEVLVGGKPIGARQRIGAVPYALATGQLAGTALRLETTACTSISNSIDCVCRPGEVAIAGGAFMGGTGALRESRSRVDLDDPDAPLHHIWRVSCVDENNAHAVCSGAYALCMRIGP